MPDPLPQSILCPILLGRNSGVAALARLLSQVYGAWVDRLDRDNAPIARSGMAIISKSQPTRKGP